MSTVAQIWKVGPKEVPEAMELIKESFTYNEVETYDLLKEKARSERELLLLAKLGGKAIGMLEAAEAHRRNLHRSGKGRASQQRRRTPAHRHRNNLVPRKRRDRGRSRRLRERHRRKGIFRQT